MKKLTEMIFDSERLFIEKDVPKEYLEDSYSDTQANPPYAVALPTSHEEIVNLVRFAENEKLTVIARGANTGVAGAQVSTTGHELIIDVHLMNHILDLDEDTLTLTVEPGVLVGDIHQYVEERGYFYPPDPASKHSSIGGNLATNAGGLRAVKYGTTRNYVREMTTVLINGKTMKLGSLNIKDSSGYDLKDLFIGSEGTLGITTEIKLKLIPLPKSRLSAIFSFDNVVKASDATVAILASGADPSAVELFEKDALKYSEQHLGYKLQVQKGEAFLLIEVDGNTRGDLVERLELAKQAASSLMNEALVLTSDEESEKAWALRDNILVGLNEYTSYEMLDEVVPINQFGALIRYTKELQEKHGMSIANFGHSGDGNVHTLLMREDKTETEWQETRKAVLNDLYKKVKELGGLPSAEHGIGVVKKPYLLKMTDEVNIEAMRQIKKAFDPDNRLNPGKVF